MTGLGGGGPLSPDPAAAARIILQYPVVRGDYTVTDSEAFAYIGRLTHLFPELNVALSELTSVGRCAVDYGVVGGKAYVTPDYTQAGAIVIVSRLQAQQLPTIAAKCFVSHVLGGGPSLSGTFQPCFTITNYRLYDRALGVWDTYYVFVAGTNVAWCDLVKGFHSNLNGRVIS